MLWRGMCYFFWRREVVPPLIHLIPTLMDIFSDNDLGAGHVYDANDVQDYLVDTAEQ